MWPFEKPGTPRGGRKFGIGDRVVLIDCPEWTNLNTRDQIGRVGVIVGLSMPERTRGQYPRPPEDYYHLVLAGDNADFYVPDPALKLIPPDGDLADPRHITDETPNKKVSWADVPYFKPKKETA